MSNVPQEVKKELEDCLGSTIENAVMSQRFFPNMTKINIAMDVLPNSSDVSALSAFLKVDPSLLKNIKIHETISFEVMVP